MKTKNPGESAELESSPAAVEPKLRASELVRRQLERDISSGVLLPGDALDEDALAKRFGVSRTPVREALLQLSVRGLVLIAPRAGTYVSRLSIPELLGLSELLAELEGACAKLATRRLTPEEAHELRRVHEESLAFESDPDPQAYSRANTRFHEILYRACRNDALMGEIAHIRRRTQVYRQSVFQNQARIRRSREEHGRILEAILAGDSVMAGHLMVDHIAAGGRDFADLISTLPQRLLASAVETYPGKQAAELGHAPAKTTRRPVGRPRAAARGKAG
ncbi:GntR family transcriptional regulator [Variovorax sp. OV700]|uniref:GntR family transcriptional regulator n=1 Tax=Variovorax sp. OV700 TaxID=1882826 RepID=UPI000881168F|nr:GntR family transcriptional regulator [Variovorax sp. OV700]SDH85687.1 transcriptional regulator, GntR family [Variovorax sp. OV700]